MEPPKRLKNEARKKWLEVFKHFNPENPLDVELACQYCENAALYEKAMAEVDGNKKLAKVVGTNGAWQPHPAIKVIKQAEDAMRRAYMILSKKINRGQEDDEV